MLSFRKAPKKVRDALLCVSLAVFAASVQTDARAEDETSAGPSGQSEEAVDLRIPRYEFERPKWGIHIAVSNRVFPDHDTASLTPTSFDRAAIRAFSLQFDYQPQALQKFGIFGVGPSLAMYPIPGGKRPWNLWSGGLQARYQARFFREQPVVPYVGYQAEYWSYLVDGYSGRTLVKGPVFGVALLLNWIDRPTTNDFYTEYGVSRSYLFAEMRILSGKDTNIRIQGNSYFFGLRFER